MEASWLYRSTEPGLYTVGFYDPNGKWNPESDHADKELAGARVHFLNGGSEKEVPSKQQKLNPDYIVRTCSIDVREIGKTLNDTASLGYEPTYMKLVTCDTEGNEFFFVVARKAS